MPDVLSPTKIAEAKEGLPRDGHNAAPATDAGKFLYGTFGRFEVLENFETRDDLGTVICEWQHSSIRRDARRGGKALQCHRELVAPIFDSDE